MNPYFICALPRSRTAWLANFLTYGPSFCFHEPFNRYALDDLPRVFAFLNREYVGISDSFSVLLIDDLLKFFPQAKLVVIRRPFEEVDNSLRKLGFPCTELLSQLNTALDYLESTQNPLVVNFNNFNAAAIWNFLMPEVPLNRERIEMLETFNITVPTEIIKKKGQELLEKWSPHMPELFGGEKKN